MLIAYELTMPNNNSWNGKWTGEGTCYAVVKSYHPKSTSKPKEGPYSYNFGDGWRAQVYVREVSSKTAAQLRKASKGFCGYEWMIDSIERLGRIEA